MSEKLTKNSSANNHLRINIFILFQFTMIEIIVINYPQILIITIIYLFIKNMYKILQFSVAICQYNFPKNNIIELKMRPYKMIVNQ